MPRLYVRAAMLAALFSINALAGAINVNGICEVGTCSSPGVLPLGTTETVPFNFIYTFDNGDRFQIQGVQATSSTVTATSENLTEGGTVITVSYLGNGVSNTPSANDVLTVHLLENLQSGGATSGTFRTHLYGGFGALIAIAGSSAARQLSVNGNLLPTDGPFSPTSPIFSNISVSTNLSNLTDPLIWDNRYTAAFGAGSMPEAAIVMSDTPIFQAPSITTGGVTPVFGTSTTIQPGSWVSIYGTNLAGAAASWNGDFPTSLGGVSVMIDAKLAPLLYVSPTQINLQVPDDATTGAVSVVVTTPGGKASSTARLAAYAPAFSLLSAKYPAASVATPGAAGNSASGYDIIGPVGAFSYATRPVKAGEIITLYGVGFGPTNPAVPAGQAFSGAAPSVTTPIITIGGVQAQVNFAGLVEPGLFQFNVVVPNVSSGDELLVATVGGATTPSNIYLAIQ